MSAKPARPLRAAVIFPGRGSYGRAELGLLGRLGAAGEPAAVRRARDAAIEAIDAQRAARSAEPLRALDGAARFTPRAHLRADNASELILACAMADLGLIRAAAAPGDAGAPPRLQVVAVAGNSLGFYLALIGAGALSLADGARLVSTMASLQLDRPDLGGQLVYPVCDPTTWRPDPERQARVEAALRLSEGEAWLSIRLGGSAVIAGSAAGLRAVEAALPPEERGGRRYPLRLAGHAAFHTPLLAPVASAAAAALRGLGWRRPAIPLVDGRGAVWTPLGADPTALARYTLGAQVTSTFDLTAAVRVLLREYAPDLLIATGPGETLGAPIGQVLVEEGWAGMRSRSAFLERQAAELDAPAGEGPLLCALGRPSDRARLIRWLAEAATTAG